MEGDNKSNISDLFEESENMNYNNRLSDSDNLLRIINILNFTTNTSTTCSGCKSCYDSSVLSNIIFYNKNILTLSQHGSVFDGSAFIFDFETNGKNIDIESVFNSTFRFNKNLKFTNPKVVKHENNIDLKICLTNIFSEFNQNVKKNEAYYKSAICDKCIIMLTMTGVLIKVKDECEIVINDFYCCFSCDQPTYDNNPYFIRKYSVNNKPQYKLTDRLKYVDYIFDSKNILESKYDCSINYSFCKKCFSDYSKDKTVHHNESYYYDQMFDATSLICFSCNKTNKFDAKTKFLIEEKLDRPNIDWKCATNDIDFGTVLVTSNILEDEYISNKLPLKNNLVVYNSKNLQRFTYNNKVSFYCVTEYSIKIKNSYLQKYLSVLSDILPLPLCNIILDYYVLYYHHCNNCFNNNRKNKNILQFVLPPHKAKSTDEDLSDTVINMTEYYLI